LWTVRRLLHLRKRHWREGGDYVREPENMVKTAIKPNEKKKDEASRGEYPVHLGEEKKFFGAGL